MARRVRPRGGRVLLIGLIALGLSGCLFEPTPPTPPPLTPTPSPVPTPTPEVQRRIALPTPAPSPTPAPTPIPELRGAGQLLYLDSIALRYGIVLANADGSDRRLLVEGPYSAVAWAPDGRRFAAVSSTAGGTPNQVEIFTPDGRTIQRFAFAVVGQTLLWSPDARHLAVLARAEEAGSPGSLTTWMLTEETMAEVGLGLHNYALSWSPDGRLLLTVTEDGDGNGRLSEGDRRTLWTVAATGGEARRLAEANDQPAGWSGDGGTLYTLGAVQQRGAGARARPVPTALLAIDARTGAQAPLITADALGVSIWGDVRPQPAYWLGGAAVAPGGERIAVWLNANVGDRTEQDGPPVLAVLDQAGRLVWRERAQSPTAAGAGQSWSPDGTKLAYRLGPETGLRIRAFAGPDAAAAPFALGPVDSRPTIRGALVAEWSPDGRWLIFSRQGRLEIAATAPPARSWTLTTSSAAPSWRP